MRMTRRTWALSLLVLVLAAPRARAAGARSFKSGPIQISADGKTVWVANPYSDSVSRIDTATYAMTEFPLPFDATTRQVPRGISVLEDGSEVWVACHDSDRIYVLSGATGALLDTIQLPWGSGPWSLALSRPDLVDGKQKIALVTLHRSAALAAIDTTTHAATIISPVFWAPLGVAWMEDHVSAWVTHPYADIEGTYITRVDFSDAAKPRVTSKIHVLSSAPLSSLNVTNPPAEGGYLHHRGHLAQIPGATGLNEIWLPTQYSNLHDDAWTPDSSFQAVLRKLDLATRTLPNLTDSKIVFTAVNVHDPQSVNGGTYVDKGWNAHIGGPVDIAFSADGKMAYMLNELSDDLVPFPTNLPSVNAGGLNPPLSEIPVGSHPMGLAVSPIADVAFVSNEFSADVSVIDLAARAALRSPVTVTSLPFGGGAALTGAKIFFASDDPRISVSAKGTCASCHIHAEGDGRGWALEQLQDSSGVRPSAHGPRNTPSLLGVGLSYTPGQLDPATGWGQLHRSGDRDEVEDFDHAFQGELLGGTGFLGAGVCPKPFPPVFVCSNSSQAPGNPIHDLATYVDSLPPLMRSPHRAAGGALSEAALRGATFFKGANAAKKADAACGGCHDPANAFVDFKFYDVGTYRDFRENELNKRAPNWLVNTASLVGVWATPTYDGVARYLTNMVDVMVDFALPAPARTLPHGTLAGLTRHQLRDLAEFVDSIDGAMTASDVSQARDTLPPRVTRVSAASLTTVNVWFSESVDPASAATPANWNIVKQGGTLMPVFAATFDPQNGDHVILTTALETSCAVVSYTVKPVGAIYDFADSASGGARNTLDVSDPANSQTINIGATLTVTLGASGYEDITIPIHDVGIAQNVNTIGYDSLWLDPVKGRKGLLRFAWEAPFKATTGLTQVTDILAASFTLTGDYGDTQPVELRRVLQLWNDVAVAESDSTTQGRTTWQYRLYNSTPALAKEWNQPGLAALGGTGAVLADYNAAFDAAGVIDATIAPTSVNQPAVFSAPEILSAFQFWFANPQVDYGWLLELKSGSTNELKFFKTEATLGAMGPVMTVTYKLATPSPTQPPEVSGTSASPLLAIKEGTSVRLYFEDLAGLAASYNLYEGILGTWFSHTGAACNVQPGLAGARRDYLLAPQTGGRYFEVTASDACAEGPAASSYPPGLNTCLP